MAHRLQLLPQPALPEVPGPVGGTREVMRSLRRLIAADNMTQKENAKVEAQLAIARAMMRAGRP
ncbi:hypothetical protein NKH16_32400 [Mesorhizobium sp. M1307]|uniref:hypothetical protein n=1 Tax=Mesorhizobium sp. M1307 TaxID=2957079 RepID=UPI0033362ACB